MTEAELKELYDVYWQEVPVGSGYDGYVRAKGCLEEKIEFDSVLDVGCGNGSAVEIFTQAGKKVMGVEYSHWLVETWIKKKFPKNNIIEGDASELPFPDNSFDLVFCSEVLEHLPEEKVYKALGEMYRIARKYFYGSVCYRQDERGKYHLTIQPKEWWQKAFERVGFIPIKVNEGIHFYKK